MNNNNNVSTAQRTKTGKPRVRLRRPPRQDYDRLKAERVQGELKRLGWKSGPDGQVLRRTRKFTCAKRAAYFMVLAAEVADSAGRQMTVDLSKSGRFSIALIRRKGAGLTEADVTIAQSIG